MCTYIPEGNRVPHQSQRFPHQRQESVADRKQPSSWCLHFGRQDYGPMRTGICSNVHIPTKQHEIRHWGLFAYWYKAFNTWQYTHKMPHIFHMCITQILTSMICWIPFHLSAQFLVSSAICIDIHYTYMNTTHTYPHAHADTHTHTHTHADTLIYTHLLFLPLYIASQQDTTGGISRFTVRLLML